MNTTKIAATSTLVTAMALGTLSLVSTAHAQDWTQLKGIHVEKVYGIAKAGKNDCSTKTHQCAGMSTVNGDPQSWIFLPQGVSSKIVGGSLKPGR